MKLLKEIANLEPYPYTVSKAGAEFLDKAGNRIGVIFEFFDLDLPTRAIKVVNIAFGVLKVDQKNAIENIDQSLTNAGDARRVISTVGEIIVSNKRVQEEADCIVLAGSDKAKERRQQIYAIATQDIINKLPRFKDRKYFKITFTGGAMGIVSLALDLTAAETEFIKTHLQVLPDWAEWDAQIIADHDAGKFAKLEATAIATDDAGLTDLLK